MHTDKQEPISWSAGARAIGSLLIGLHLFAVFASPWSGPPPASGLARAAGAATRPYAQALAIDNGYRFFAPNPEVSHIVRYAYVLKDGSKSQGEFPDRKRHWPRLLYHRHLMLAESLFQLTTAAPDLPPEVQKELDADPIRKAAYEWDRERARRLIRSLANELLDQNADAQSVELVLHEHAIPTPDDILSGVKLTDSNLYSGGITLGVYNREVEQESSP